jgi:hypothetical protein
MRQEAVLALLTEVREHDDSEARMLMKFGGRDGLEKHLRKVARNAARRTSETRSWWAKKVKTGLDHSVSEATLTGPGQEQIDLAIDMEVALEEIQKVEPDLVDIGDLLKFYPRKQIAAMLTIPTKALNPQIERLALSLESTGLKVYHSAARR